MNRLGAFELVKPIGKGGMSDVWLARHIDSQTKAAVKLIPPKRVDSASRAALDHEIRTIAGLDHKGIVWVYDHGTVAPSVSTELPTILPDSPYLVMEYASQTLHDLLPIRSWSELRGVLVELLDAFVHAHARGVIHRDLKPGNILVCGPQDVRPGLKLTDFGIAHALDTVDPTTGKRAVVGTPRYMPPEQIEGDWRSLGPATDLYSLGCLVFRCIHDHGPFRSRGTRLLLDHLRTPAPRLELPEGFPKELADWTSWLLQKEVLDRPSSAARALDQLPDGPMAPLRPRSRPRQDEAPTRPIHHTPPPAPRRSVPTSRPAEGREWRKMPRHAGEPRGLGGRHLRHAGRNLLGLRTPPMVGRHAERNDLWSSLRQAIHRGDPSKTWVTGPPGIGRSRLLEWFENAVLEADCARVWTFRVRADADLVVQLQRLLRDVLRTRGLVTERERVQQVRTALGRWGVASSPLIELATRPGSDLGVVLAGWMQLLQRQADQGPILVMVDDIDTRREGEDLALELAELTGPVCLVFATQSNSALGKLLPKLRERPLGPLRGDDWHRFVANILPLSPSLEARVEERSTGNPRFAVQLLTDWVQRDQLIDGPNGFDAAASLELPRNLAALWSARLDELVLDADPNTRRTLQMAAVLGMDVQHDELTTLVPDSGFQWHALLTRMALSKLVEIDPSGFSFVHPALREVLLERAKQEGHLQDLHRTVALHLYGKPDATSQRRTGRHLAAAGDVDRAFELLTAAARETRSSQGLGPALVLCDEANDLLTRDDSRRARVLNLRARILNTGRNYEAARTIAGRALKLAETRGWDQYVIEASSHLGVAAYHQSNHDLARQRFRFVIERGIPERDAEAMGRACSHLGWLGMLHGQADDARPFFVRAAEHYNEAGDRDSAICALLVQTDLAYFEEDFAQAEALMDATWALTVEAAQPVLQAQVLERRAYLAALQEKYPEARHLCERVLAVAALLSSGVMSRLQMLYGHVCLRLDDREVAYLTFQACTRPASLPESPLEQAMVYAGCVASTERLDEHEPFIRRMEQAFDKGTVKHPILVDLVEMCLERAASDDHRTRLRTLRDRALRGS